MSHDPFEFITEQLPALFSRGMAALELRDNERAKRTLADVRSARGSVRIVVAEAKFDGWLVVEAGQLRWTTEKPEPIRTRFAISIPEDALRGGLEELRTSVMLDSDTAAMHFTQMASGRMDQLLEAHSWGFKLIVEGTPDLGDVSIRAALHQDCPPETPEFSATVQYDDLEALRDGSLNPQSLLLGGKLRLTGNYAPALQLGMQLMQQASAK